MNDKISYASAKPSEEILALFERAKELDADGLGNAEVLERAGHYLVEHEQTLNFKAISRKKRGAEYKGELPSSFKVRINDPDLYSSTIATLQKAFTIKRVMTPFLMRITLAAYIEHLEKDSGSISDGDTLLSDTTIASLKLQAISKIIALEDKELLMKIINSCSN